MGFLISLNEPPDLILTCPILRLGKIKQSIKDNMNTKRALAKLDKELLHIYPFKHFVIPNFLEDSDFESVYKDLIVLEAKKPHSEFKSNFGIKQEWKSPMSNESSLAILFDFFASDIFIEKLKLVFGLPNSLKLDCDRTYDGGGYVKSPPNSFLSYHADFNFSSNVNKYRSLNVLFYANKDYDRANGGILHCLDPESKTVEVEVLPLANTLFAFITDDEAFHGVSRNSANFTRRSFNIYYYSDEPISSRQSTLPHKTIWMNFNNNID